MSVVFLSILIPPQNSTTSLLSTNNKKSTKKDEHILISVSHAYGYGLMDAYGMVTRAKNWTLVPPQRICTKSVISDSQTPRILSSGGREIIPVEVILFHI